MLEVSLALFSILFVLWISWRWKQTSTFSDLGIPGPKPSLLFGNIIELYEKGPVKCQEEWVKKYGRVFGYYYGMRPILLVADPQMLKSVFVKDFQKFIDRVPFNPIARTISNDELDHSVLSLRGQKWKEVRSVLTPTFTSAKLKQMAVTMNSTIDVMLNILREKAKNNEVFNILDTYQRLTMDVIARTAFGVSVDIQTNTKSGLLHATQLLFYLPYKNAIVFVGMCFPGLRWLVFKFQTLLLSILNRGISPVKMLQKGIFEVLGHRRSHPGSKKPDLLQLMIDTKISLNFEDVDVRKLEAEDHDNEKEVTPSKEDNEQRITRNMTNEEIVASSVTVFLAGYETTSTALGFTSYLLAKHQDIQEKAFEEIYQLMQNGGKLEYGTVNKLPYLEKILQESMRIYPPVYLFTNRFAGEDVEYDNLKIPKGMIVQAPVHLMHHDPEYWTDPEVFDPERFDTKPNRDGITYLPFGVGPRNCMGMRFAQMEAKLALAHTICNFRIHLADPQKTDLHTTLRVRTIAPTHGIQVRVENRSQETAL